MIHIIVVLFSFCGQSQDSDTWIPTYSNARLLWGVFLSALIKGLFGNRYLVPLFGTVVWYLDLVPPISSPHNLVPGD
jgi:hypothetical protein